MVCKIALINEEVCVQCVNVEISMYECICNCKPVSKRCVLEATWAYNCCMYKGHFLRGNWIELSLKDRYLRKGYYVGVANRSSCQSDSYCYSDACACNTYRPRLLFSPLFTLPTLPYPLPAHLPIVL